MLLQNKIRRFTTEASEITWEARVACAVPLLALSLLSVFATSTFGQSDTTLAAAQTQTPPKTWFDAGSNQHGFVGVDRADDRKRRKHGQSSHLP